MAAGTSRVLRYVLFAFFGVIILYFISQSSIPTSPIPKSLEGSGESDEETSSGAALAPSSVVKPVDDKPQASAPAPVSPNPSSTLSPLLSGNGKMNATFVTLARNSDLWEIAKSIRHVEDRFNKNYHYDWVFLNDKPFSAEFKSVTTALISGKTYYGEIPQEHWSFPEWIDQEKAKKVREEMHEKNIIYGDSISYRHMCRFESGFFFRQPLMNQFEWYWRVEPSIELYCEVGYDPFKYMQDHDKKYGFVLSLHEYVETIETLWDSTKKFIKAHKEHIVEGNAMEWLSDDKGETYNNCHFWSNFEIGNLSWLRSQAYLDYFETLDKDGGFFYERWGDAPVHSIAAGLLLKKEQIHFFDDIAYYHVPFTHCPTGEQRRIDLKCSCNPKENFDWKDYSCTTKFFDVLKLQKPAGYELERD